MDKVELIHGAGGSATDKLIKEVFLAALGNEYLNDLEDAALILWPQGELAFSTDSFTVQPLFFPGGDIGRLAAAGTVNDLLMRGARPLYLSAAFIIEEGFPVKKLTTVVRSLAVTCRQAGVRVVTGDTKVVPRGSEDGLSLFITTSGLGLPAPNVNISIKNARAGDKIIVSGSMGDHELAVLAEREGFSFSTPLASDVAPLVDLVTGLLPYKDAVRVLRDPTRGGVAEVLHNIAGASKVGIEIWEGALPIRSQVLVACELFGFDPLHLANEGKLVAVVDPAAAEDIVATMRKRPYGQDAALVGEVNDSGLVTIRTRFNTMRMLHRPLGGVVPRIC